jgi:hypothetical protein
MGRNNDDFRNQVILHRGLSFVSPNELNNKELGVHWTEDHEVAQRFAETMEEGEPGLIVHGAVRPEDIVSPKDDDWKEYARMRGISDKEDWEGESETTVRKGSRVQILGYTQTDKEGNPVKVVTHKSPKEGRT